MSAQTDFDALDLDNNDNPAELRRFIDAYKKDAPELVARVRERLISVDAVRRQRAREQARERDSVMQYKHYLQTYGSRMDEAGIWREFENRIKELERLDDDAFAAAEAADTAKAYRAYLRKFPEGRHRGAADKEVGKRHEYLRGLVSRTDGEGRVKPRWLFVLLILPFVIVATGIAGMLAVSVYAIVFGSFGTIGLGVGLIAFFATIYLVVRFALGGSAEDAWIAPVVIGLSMLLVLLAGSFLGLM